MTDATVFVVDDDDRVLRGTGRMLGALGYRVELYTDARNFLAKHDPAVPGCLLLDLVLPDMDGLHIQQLLEINNEIRPVVFMSGCSDVGSAVRAMKLGALDFLIKPLSVDRVKPVVEVALRRDNEQRRRAQARRVAGTKLARLTPREREVLPLLLTGMLNKQIAQSLGTVEKTIKVHRSRVFKKLGVSTLLELERFIRAAEIDL